MFVKVTKDRQEADLKRFYMPYDHDDFGAETPDDYGVVTYMDDNGVYHEETVVTVKGGCQTMYEDIYETIVNGKPQVIKHEETIWQMEMLEEGISQCRWSSDYYCPETPAAMKECVPVFPDFLLMSEKISEFINR